MKQSGWGIASLVCGIAGILLACVAIGAVPAIIGLVCAIIALTQKGKGHGTAIAGLIWRHSEPVIYASVALLLLATVLTIWSMVMYLKAAWVYMKEEK